MHEIMGFILPFIFASGEAMIGVLILVILIVLGRGKILPSVKPLVIERKGQYKIILAPGLNLAQPFIEAIVKQVALREDAKQDGLILGFEVRDKNIASRKKTFYLLEVSLQNGCLCFDASPAPQKPILPNTTSFVCDSQAVLDEVENAIHAVAKLWGIGLQRINY